MAFSKTIFLLAFVIAVTLAYRAKNVSHDFILGSRISGDRLVLQKTVYKPSRSWKIISYKESFNTTRFTRISQVAAYDQKTNGKGAFASFVKGGPGTQNVTLKFRSQRGHGIHFIVRVYGR